MKMEFLVNDDTNHVIVRITEKDLAKIIKKIKKSTGLPKSKAKEFWKRRINAFAVKQHNANLPIKIEIIKP